MSEKEFKDVSKMKWSSIISAIIVCIKAIIDVVFGI